MITRLYLGLILLLLSSSIIGQSTHIYFGLLQSGNSSPEITEPGTHHRGYLVGLDKRILGRGLYVLGGAQYFRVASKGSVTSEFLKPSDPLHYVKARMGLGLTPLALTRFLKCRVKMLAGYQYILGGYQNMGNAGYSRDYKSLDAGLGITVGLFTVDVEYTRGLDNVLPDDGNSKYHTWLITAGIEF